MTRYIPVEAMGPSGYFTMKVRVQRVLYFGNAHFVVLSYQIPVFIVTILPSGRTEIVYR